LQLNFEVQCLDILRVTNEEGKWLISLTEVSVKDGIFHVVEFYQNFGFKALKESFKIIIPDMPLNKVKWLNYGSCNYVVTSDFFGNIHIFKDLKYSHIIY